MKFGPTAKTLLRWVRMLTLQLAIAAALLLLLEGAASFRAAWKRINWGARADLRPTAESIHTNYDPLLGWISRPGHYTNLYGEGRDLTIEPDGARLTPSDDMPPPSLRVVASGDSFTMGYGVGDDQTWVAHLENQHPALDIKNLGLGGYGLGQAFLRYQRDGVKLPHDLHLFAYITENFRRAGRDRFMGYGKPVVTVEDGELAVENVPPPRRRHSPLFQIRYGAAIQELQIIRWLTAGAAERLNAERTARQKNIQRVAHAIFNELHELHEENGRTGVFIHFPVESDYSDGDSNGWRHWMREEARSNNWHFVDLVPTLRALPRDQVRDLFIQDDTDRFRGAKGHYTELGNALMARTLLDELLRRGLVPPATL
ncbi:MAG TPA: hypothetical protein PKE12_14685 [Kiritimatiellia bacterium]|nr:hypothetical protein [Kiritimatiellia bacterium]